MNSMMKAGLRATLATTTILGGTILMIAPAMAQTTTASIRGQVSDEAGELHQGIGLGLQSRLHPVKR